VLSAFTYKGENAPTLQQRAKQLEYYKTHNTRLRDRAMIESIFTRDGLPTAYDPWWQRRSPMSSSVRRSGADRHLSRHDLEAAGRRSLKVLCPVLMLRGDHDGISTNADLLEFYDKLPNGDRQFVILPTLPTASDIPTTGILANPHDAGVPHHAAAGRVVTRARPTNLL